MSIGLLTFHRQLNYGGVLQALALHDTLQELTHRSVETIDLWLNPRDTPLLGKVHNPNLPLYSRLRNALKARKTPFGREAFELRRKKTKHLIETRLNLSAKHYRSSRDLQHLPHYETVVVGSDQVWNYDLLSAFSTNPWLTPDFPPNQDRIAYAASFGVSELPETLIPIYQTGLGQFRAVTIREASGCSLFKQLMGQGWDVESPVVDPTLLRTRTQWEQEITEHSHLYTPHTYLLCYWLDALSPARIQWLHNVSVQHGLPVILLVSAPLQWLPDAGDWLTVRFDADPLDFVALIAHAQGIITDSFHGLQFSAIFKRPIVCCVGQDTSGNSATARFHDFCDRYGVPEVCQPGERIQTSPYIPFVPLERNLDVTRLEHDRETSLQRLQAMLTPILSNH